MIKGEEIFINGDGETSRDFCYVENVIQINLLAAITSNKEAINQIYNVAVGDRTTLSQLYDQLQLEILSAQPEMHIANPIYRDFRAGDVRHSLADITKSINLLGYKPLYRVPDGLKIAMQWYLSNLGKGQ